jgi:hypothetical protein
MGIDNPERKATLDSYGYYEDDMEKVNGGVAVQQTYYLY